jgi:hypothetical protein
MWLVTVPVWGDGYVDTFINRVLPSIERAATHARMQVNLVVHTDERYIDRIREATTLPVAFYQIPLATLPYTAPGSFVCLSHCHREAMALARPSIDHLMLLTADMLISEEAFIFCEEALSMAAIVVLCGLRADMKFDGEDTSSGKALSRWGWDHRHPIIEEAIWPEGHNQDMSRLYFVEGVNVVARLGLPHPLALKKDFRSLNFMPTIDADLVYNFAIPEIRVVRNGEVSVVELSPADKDFNRMPDTVRERITAGQVTIPRRAHIQRWLYQQQVVLCGEPGDYGDDQVVNLMLKADPNPPAPMTRTYRG